MQRVTEDRLDRAVTAGMVLAAHIALVWIAIQVRAHYIDTSPGESAPPVIARLIEQPRTLSLGSVPIPVRTENVLRLQRYAPQVPDIPVETSDHTITDTEQQLATAAGAQRAEDGLAGSAGVSSGHSAGGYVPLLVERVVPKYPTRSARLGEEGATRLHIRVEESGRVVEVRVTSSSGIRRLDDAAIDAARKWKFARMPAGAAPDGAWVATELRFILYRFRYSRIDEDVTNDAYAEAVKIGASDEAAPGGREALGRFIADVLAGAAVSHKAALADVARMRAALQEWGDVKSIRFTGAAGGPQWIGYRVDAERPRELRPTVEVKWNTFEVRHQNATSEWLIAVDREGTVWNARASRAPWL